MPIDFQCNKCGLCCKEMDKVLDIKKAPKRVRRMIKRFPFKHKNGVCEKLQDNICTVYDHRPGLCNIKKFRKIAFPNLPGEIFYEAKTKNCELLNEKRTSN
jgi:Fe-S-cluster containining protein